MLTPHFSGKLDTLTATLDLFRNYDMQALGARLEDGVGRHVVSIGSGGSAIVAEYLARCRDTLGLGPTTVQTPMQFVLEHHNLRGSDVWLFSAGGDNADVVAAARAAADRKAGSVVFVTRNPDGAAIADVRAVSGTVHLVPVADAKDGYLATHSLLSSVTALLLASSAICGDPRDPADFLDAIASRLLKMRDPSGRDTLIGTLAGLSSGDTLIVAADPSLRPLAVLLDTSLWEASLCHVQTTDFRNLAHGRHAWLHHRASETLIVALTTVDSRQIWSSIVSFLPELPRRLVFDHAGGGRLDNALSIVDGLGLIEAIGAVVGMDPGKPGIGSFGKAIYDDQSLDHLGAVLSPRVRHKRAAVAKADTGEHGGIPMHEIWRDRIAVLVGADIRAAVFDYDGTLVTTEGRWDPPIAAIANEIVRLHGLGLRIGIATGRGGSAGEDLRKILPPEVLRDIVIGYYNGGCLRAADVDLRTDPPPPDPAIAATAAWLDGRPDLFAAGTFRARPIQITVDMAALGDRYRFPMALADCPTVADGSVRLTASGHSYDILPVATTKLAVVDALRDGLVPNAEILRFGDSCAKSGNDYALTSHPLGISVDEVCGSPNGCWSLLGGDAVGPDAILRILQALVPSESGGFRLDVGSLGLDIPEQKST